MLVLKVGDKVEIGKVPPGMKSEGTVTQILGHGHVAVDLDDDRPFMFSGGQILRINGVAVTHRGYSEYLLA